MITDAEEVKARWAETLKVMLQVHRLRYPEDGRSNRELIAEWMESWARAGLIERRADGRYVLGDLARGPSPRRSEPQPRSRVMPYKPPQPVRVIRLKAGTHETPRAPELPPPRQPPPPPLPPGMVRAGTTVGEMIHCTICGAPANVVLPLQPAPPPPRLSDWVETVCPRCGRRLVLSELPVVPVA